jgi:hypothetical protein
MDYNDFIRELIEEAKTLYVKGAITFREYVDMIYNISLSKSYLVEGKDGAS